MLNPYVLYYLKWVGIQNTLKTGAKTCFLIKDNEVQDRYNEIWYVIKDKLGTELHSKPVYEYKHLKAKVREFDGVIKNKLFG